MQCRDKCADVHLLSWCKHKPQLLHLHVFSFCTLNSTNASCGDKELATVICSCSICGKECSQK